MPIFEFHLPSPVTERYMDLSLLFYGKQDCDPGHYWGPGLRDIYILHYVHSGTGQFRSGEASYDLRAGQGFLISPGALVYYKADEADPWTYSWIGLKGLHAKTLLQRAGLNDSSPIFEAAEQNAFFENCYEQFHQAHDAYPNSGDVYSQSLLYRYMAELVACSKQPAPPSYAANTRETYINKAVAFIENSYSLPISIQDIAKFVGLDRTYLSGLFKAQFGVSLQAFLLRFRMNRAVELLQHKELTIGDIARSVGYTDPFLFSKMFKKVIGSSPRASRDHMNQL
ncbi:AraC family transcriptional regulator [Paenibacillus glycanilyticus]|uniref:AraC family transcriptional regulator n=1 Tax=Paenibacillus glycanilyticus TaxID=126569 RepID=A0ABQ6GJ60_9BACL|nr:AraC family transcriptional regulator [Paenibacillus glycanilyticus]GLX70873.1 AraC family transcriptional regulator [Paenibacillus glycanilyticus]